MKSDLGIPAARGMSRLPISDVRPFIPAREFEVSLAFYLGLGWDEKWRDDRLALLEAGNHRFYLQNYYVRDWADNCMLHVSVADAAAWRHRAEALLGSYPGVRVKGPQREPYGALVTYVWDPCGVLLHFAQWDQ